MITTIPTSIMQELHKLQSDGAVIYLLEIPEHSIQLARNTDDVIWDSKTWTKFWFEIDALTESSSGQVPELYVRLSNVGGFIESEILAHDNFEDSTCVLYFVNTNCLDETTPILSFTFDVMKVSCNEESVSVKLSVQNPMLLAFPVWKLHGSLCQYPSFPSDLRCGYSGLDTTCDRTISDCISKGNYARFGGQLGLVNEVTLV